MKSLNRSPNVILVCYLAIVAVVILSLPSLDNSNPLSMDEDGNNTANPIDYSGFPEEHREAIENYVSAIEKRGIPGDLLIAIAKHETGNLAAVIGKANFFGLKCIDNSRDQCTNTQTTEVYNRVSVSENLAFQSCGNIDFCAQVMANTLINLAGLEGASKQEVQAFFADRKKALDEVGRRYATDGAWADKVYEYL